MNLHIYIQFIIYDILKHKLNYIQTTKLPHKTKTNTNYNKYNNKEKKKTYFLPVPWTNEKPEYWLQYNM